MTIIECQACLTSRQEKILNIVIQEYIKSAQPISSKSLEKSYNLGICPASIRIEMQKLADAGFISQPHISAGRIPTDKGYRFFVDKILEENFDGCDKDTEIDLQNIKKITEFLAKESSSLALGYLLEDKIFWKDGWNRIFLEPEFAIEGFVVRFVEILNDFEKKIEPTISSEIKVYIGQENSFSKIHDFSIISSGIFTILGPKRMNYDKNINLLKKTIKWQKKTKKK